MYLHEALRAADKYEVRVGGGVTASTVLSQDVQGSGCCLSRAEPARQRMRSDRQQPPSRCRLRAHVPAEVVVPAQSQHPTGGCVR